METALNVFLTFLYDEKLSFSRINAPCIRQSIISGHSSLALTGQGLVPPEIIFFADNFLRDLCKLCGPATQTITTGPRHTEVQKDPAPTNPTTSFIP